LIESRDLYDGILGVSDVTRYLKEVFEHDAVLQALSIRGEISDYSRSANGHCYFTLKDTASQIACVMFRREASGQEAEVQQLRRGVSVIAHGYLTLYEARGNYQICVQRVLVEGEGAASRRSQQLKLSLESEGLFDPGRKRPIPPFPRRVALVTSPKSQAYHDVLHRFSTQYPFVQVIEVGVSVQGPSAADEMSMALDIVNRLTDADVILLVRGGGSPEELSAFNEERLARAIFASRIPVITGVGHEMDYTIVDFVADKRAATPSLAAAAAVPDVASLVLQGGSLQRQIAQIVGQKVTASRRQWLQINQVLLRSSPEQRLKNRKNRSRQQHAALEGALTAQMRANRARLRAAKAQLQALDPLAVLQRGYAVLTDPITGNIVRAPEQTHVGGRLQARVAEGDFMVRVEER